MTKILSSVTCIVCLITFIGLSDAAPEKGDVNGDGKVRSNDALLALRIVVGLLQPTEAQKEAADMDNDGKIKSNDAFLILQKAVGLEAGPALEILSAQAISIPKIEAEAGSLVEAPINIDGEVKNVGSIDVTLTYDAKLLTAKEVVSIVAGFTALSNLNDAGKVIIGAFSSDGLGKEIAAGAMFKVKFEVNTDAKGGDKSDLTLEEMVLSGANGKREETALEVENGEFMVSRAIIERISPEIGQISGGDEVTITGNYFQDGATVTIGGNPAEMVSVSETQITARIPKGELGITDVVVTNPDGGSSTLLRGFAYIPIYGDVSGNGTVSAYDAALILQFVVGLISELPVQKIGAPNQNITQRNYTVSIPKLSAKVGSKIQVPIVIDDTAGLFAGGISIKYDASVLKAVDALPTKMLNGSYWKANVSLPSEVRFAFATTELMQGSGSLLTVEFQVLPGTEGKSSPLSFSSINLSNSLSVGKIDGLVNVLPVKTVLLPNYPNPFNPETWIPYKLSQDAPVAIYIYSSNGQLIRTLNLGHQSAGIYVSKAQAARWDGRDSLGQKVASGIYYYTLQAVEFRATRKMVILK